MKHERLAILALLTAVICLAALNPAQAAEEWAHRHDEGAHDVAMTLFLHPNGTQNQYCADTYDGTGGCDILIQKRDSSGNIIWTAPLYDSPDHHPDHVKAAARCPAGSVVAVGHSDPPAGSNWRIIKYKATGEFHWQQAQNGPAGKDDVAEDVVVNDDGWVYVAGWFTNSDDSKSMAIQKYWKNDRDTIWTQTVDNYPVWWGIEKPVHVKVDSSGDPYLAGAVYDSAYENYRVMIRRYNPDGTTKIPADRFCGPTSASQVLRDMVIVSDYIYLTGKQTDADGVQLFAYKIRCDFGTGGWEAAFGLSGHDVSGTSIAVDSSGNVYVLGRCTEPVNDHISVLVKYNSSGTKQWDVTFTTSPSGRQCLALESSGNPVVAAQSHPGGGIITRWFSSSDGSMTREEIYDNEASGEIYSASPAAIAIDPSNNVYVVGSGRLDGSWPSDPEHDTVVLKY